MATESSIYSKSFVLLIQVAMNSPENQKDETELWIFILFYILFFTLEI